MKNNKFAEFVASTLRVSSSTLIINTPIRRPQSDNVYTFQQYYYYYYCSTPSSSSRPVRLPSCAYRLLLLLCPQWKTTSASEMAPRPILSPSSSSLNAGIDVVAAKRAWRRDCRNTRRWRATKTAAVVATTAAATTAAAVTIRPPSNGWWWSRSKWKTSMYETPAPTRPTSPGRRQPRDFRTTTTCTSPLITVSWCTRRRTWTTTQVRPAESTNNYANFFVRGRAHDAIVVAYTACATGSFPGLRATLSLFLVRASARPPSLRLSCRAPSSTTARATARQRHVRAYDDNGVPGVRVDTYRLGDR